MDKKPTTIEQMALFPSGPSCHFKGCTEPVVGSSAKRNAYVCKKHNEMEWATALSRGKDGYWKTFGKRWLAEMGDVA